ncbi:hypothetical protein TNCV_2010511 [Trichonephila clavipes]|nr:hypothetical protein TNCV_2010511 [Trichonephila clavipes]
MVSTKVVFVPTKIVFVSKKVVFHFTSFFERVTVLNYFFDRLYDTYMDDIVSGAPDLETAQQLQSQLKDALQSFGMNLHKWSSNSP